MTNKESFRYKHYLRVIKRLANEKILPSFTYENYLGVKNNHLVKCMTCNFEFMSSFDSGQTPKCPRCSPNRLTINLGHPAEVELKCERCEKSFRTIWKKRAQRFCSVVCKCEFIKKSKRELAPCLNCGKMFERTKNNRHCKGAQPTQYCSNKCRSSSPINLKKKRTWGLSDKNHRRKPECQLKGKQTRLEKYGDKNYNNPQKTAETTLKNYGVTCYFDSKEAIKSNGKRISKFQRKIYELTLKEHTDALLEEYLPDVNKSVDIYIPSKKKIIECYGDYWHCNPKKYSSNYYNKSLKMTAKEKWNKDAERICQLTSYGYDVEIRWETD